MDVFRFSPQNVVPLSDGFNVTQNATLDIANIPNRQLFTPILYDAGKLVSRLENKYQILTCLHKALGTK